MIRINLLDNIVVTAGSASAAPTGLQLTRQEKVALIVRVIVVLVPTALFYVYNQVTFSQLSDQLATAQADNQKLKTERAKYGDTGPRVRKFTKDKERIDHEVEIVRGIAANRLREVKAFDALQTLLPAGAWLKKIEIDGNRVSVIGYVKSDDGVPQLIKAMESSAYFSHVEPKNTSSEKTETGLAKKFEIDMSIGKQAAEEKRPQ